MSEQSSSSTQLKSKDDEYVTKELNRLTEMYIESVRGLRKEYSQISLKDKFDKIICLIHMDKLNAKQTVHSVYDNFLNMYKYNMIALYYTVQEIESFITEIDELMFDDSESSVSSSSSESSRSRGKNRRH